MWSDLSIHWLDLSHKNKKNKQRVSKFNLVHFLPGASPRNTQFSSTFTGPGHRTVHDTTTILGKRTMDSGKAATDLEIARGVWFRQGLLAGRQEFWDVSFAPADD